MDVWAKNGVTHMTEETYSATHSSSSARILPCPHTTRSQWHKWRRSRTQTTSSTW